MLKRIVALLLCVLLCMPYLALADVAGQYDAAQTLLSQGAYEEAAAAFDALGAYADAPLLAMYCRALTCAENGEYDRAIAALTALSDYKDCRMRVVYYTARMQEDAAGDDRAQMEQAHQTYRSIPLYLDSDARAAALASRILRAEAAETGRVVISDETGERLSTATLLTFEAAEDVETRQVVFSIVTRGTVEAIRIVDAQGNEIPLTGITQEHSPSCGKDMYALCVWQASAALPDGYTGTITVHMREGDVWISGGNTLELSVRYMSEPLQQYTTAYGSIAELKAAGQALVRDVEGEGIVLLKNEGVLPLARGSEVALVGVSAVFPVYGGTGTGYVDADDAPDFRDALQASGLKVVNSPMLDAYWEEYWGRRPYGSIGEMRWKWLKRKSKNDDGDETVGNGEHAVFVIGRAGGEGYDLDGDIVDDARNGDYLTLNENEIDILEHLAEMKKDGDVASITVIINSANPISVGFLNNPDYAIDAALWVGAPGQTGLYAVGDVLCGDVTPSGCLPDTWWQDNQANPVQHNFGVSTYEGADALGMTGEESGYVVYAEGVYLGYRYTETVYEDQVMRAPGAPGFRWADTVAYPFGYGLSYTTFAMEDMRVEKTGTGRDAAYAVSVTVTNTGAAAGKKTVQVYAQKPYTDYDREYGIEKPAVELVGYAKTDILAPGASETVTVTVPEYFLTSYDAEGTGVFILSEGTHYLTVADNAHAAANNILASKGYATEDGMTDPGDNALVFAVEYAFDATTYAQSWGTGAQVRSLFGETDINRYSGRGANAVTYLSRSSWVNSTMALLSGARLTATPQMAADARLDDSDLPEASGEWPLMGQRQGILLADMIGYAYDDPQWDVFLDQLTYDELAILSACGLRMTAAVEAIAKPQTLDHNGPNGMTQKYSAGPSGYATLTADPDMNQRGTIFPCNGIVAATFNDELTQRVGQLIGEDCAWAGYAGVYGTGLNLHRSPYSGYYGDRYSEDSVLSGLMGAAWTQGVQRCGVYVYLRHLVLNGQEDGRSGLSTWCSEQALRELYLRAFEIPIVRVGAKCVETSYNRLGVMWTGASSALLTDWLRGEAGLTGFALTDLFDGSYMVKVHAMLAGNDVANDYAENAAEFATYGPEGDQANPAVARALRQAARRVLYTVLHSRGLDGVEAGE